MSLPPPPSEAAEAAEDTAGAMEAAAVLLAMVSLPGGYGAEALPEVHARVPPATLSPAVMAVDVSTVTAELRPPLVTSR